MNYKAYVKQQQKKYIDYSKKVESKAKLFKSNINIVNYKSGGIGNLKHNPMQNGKDNYLWFVYNQKLLEENIIKSDEEYEAIFLTLTLNSSFHKYSSYSKSYNYQYNKENTIKKGYILLNESFREIYKNFRVKRKVEKIFYSRVIEPHKDFTPHLHAIIYVKKDYILNLQGHILNIIKKNGLGRYEIEKIVDITRSTSYLLKYINKTTNPSNEKGFHKINGWKKLHKIRMFTHSNIELERYIFKKVNSTLKLSKGLENKNPISEILEQCNIQINTKCLSTKQNIFKEYKRKDNQRYKVEIGRTRKVSYKNFYLKPSSLSYFENGRIKDGFAITKYIGKHILKNEVISRYIISNILMDNDDDVFNYIIGKHIRLLKKNYYGVGSRKRNYYHIDTFFEHEDKIINIIRDNYKLYVRKFEEQLKKDTLKEYGQAFSDMAYKLNYIRKDYELNYLNDLMFSNYVEGLKEYFISPMEKDLYNGLELLFKNSKYNMNYYNKLSKFIDLHFDDIFDIKVAKSYSYKILDFKIIDNNDNKILYDKKDYVEYLRCDPTKLEENNGVLISSSLKNNSKYSRLKDLHYREIMNKILSHKSNNKILCHLLDQNKLDRIEEVIRNMYNKVCSLYKDDEDYIPSYFILSFGYKEHTIKLKDINKYHCFHKIVKA